MVKIIWTNRAFSQFERLIRYIREEQGLAYAKIVHEKIIQSISNLESFPLLGTIEPGACSQKIRVPVSGCLEPEDYLQSE